MLPTVICCTCATCCCCTAGDATAFGFSRCCAFTISSTSARCCATAGSPAPYASPTVPTAEIEAASRAVNTPTPSEAPKPGLLGFAALRSSHWLATTASGTNSCARICFGPKPLLPVICNPTIHSTQAPPAPNPKRNASCFTAPAGTFTSRVSGSRVGAAIKSYHQLKRQVTPCHSTLLSFARIQKPKPQPQLLPPPPYDHQTVSATLLSAVLTAPVSENSATGVASSGLPRTWPVPHHPRHFPLP